LEGAGGTEAELKGISSLEVKLTDAENGVLNKQASTACASSPRLRLLGQSHHGRLR